MIDLNKIQKEVYSNTRRFGYKCDKESIIKHLKGEIKEYKEAKPIMNKVLIDMVADIESDKSFIKMYEKFIKDSESCELIDFMAIALSKLTFDGVKAEDMFMLKHRYNKLRNIKK
ncbi:MAG: hypothetical protein GY928_08185 [Colwellia sp.]|nr:hypothetical protein [Colwellia sp.]